VLPPRQNGKARTGVRAISMPYHSQSSAHLHSTEEEERNQPRQEIWKTIAFFYPPSCLQLRSSLTGAEIFQNSQARTGTVQTGTGDEFGSVFGLVPRRSRLTFPSFSEPCADNDASRADSFI